MITKGLTFRVFLYTSWHSLSYKGKRWLFLQKTKQSQFSTTTEGLVMFMAVAFKANYLIGLFKLSTKK